MRAREFIVEMDRRGFLKGLAGFAASAAVPSSVVKMLSTPAGVSSLSTPAGVSALGIQAGLALLKGVQDHLGQWSGEDDDDYYDAHDDMAYELGFSRDDNIKDADGDDIGPTEQMWDLLALYDKNPEQAAAQLVKHIQAKAIDPADVKSTFTSRADDPNDWRYHDRKEREQDWYDDEPAVSAQQAVQKVATGPGAIARAATLAKAGIDKLSEPKDIQQMLPKDTGRVDPTAALPAPTRPEIELPVNVKQKVKQGEQLTEFDPGEGGFGPFKVYYEGNYLIGQFPTFEEAKGEVDFRRDADPKSATHHWRIVDGTGETVWEYDIGDEIDYHRRSKKFQRRP